MLLTNFPVRTCSKSPEAFDRAEPSNSPAANETATIKASRTSGDISSRRRFALEASTCTSNVPKSRALGDDVDCASDATLVGIELHNVEFLVLAFGAEHNQFVVLGHRQREALLA